MKGGGRFKHDLKKFYGYFTAGLYAFSSGDVNKAETSFLQAREVWPEYFGTDFLLGLTHEKLGDYHTAARYYKTYLNKLKSFHEGRYPISRPVIYSISAAGIEPYDQAEDLVSNRLDKYGIDLEDVRPVLTFPGFLVPMFAGGIILLTYFIGQYKLVPYLRLRYRVKHPPEGFWVCRYCGEENPEPVKECEECHRPRE